LGSGAVRPNKAKKRRKLTKTQEHYRKNGVSYEKSPGTGATYVRARSRKDGADGTENREHEETWIRFARKIDARVAKKTPRGRRGAVYPPPSRPKRGDT